MRSPPNRRPKTHNSVTTTSSSSSSATSSHVSTGAEVQLRAELNMKLAQYDALLADMPKPIGAQALREKIALVVILLHNGRQTNMELSRKNSGLTRRYNNWRRLKRNLAEAKAQNVELKKKAIKLYHLKKPDSTDSTNYRFQPEARTSHSANSLIPTNDEGTLDSDLLVVDNDNDLSQQATRLTTVTDTVGPPLESEVTDAFVIPPVYTHTCAAELFQRDDIDPEAIPDNWKLPQFGNMLPSKLLGTSNKFHNVKKVASAFLKTLGSFRLPDPVGDPNSNENGDPNRLDENENDINALSRDSTVATLTVDSAATVTADSPLGRQDPENQVQLDRKPFPDYYMTDIMIEKRAKIEADLASMTPEVAAQFRSGIVYEFTNVTTLPPLTDAKTERADFDKAVASNPYI